MVIEDTKQWTLTAMDRCDAGCSAQAYVIVKGVTGELMFCSHHYNKFLNDAKTSEKLKSFAYEIIDETERLIENRLIGEN